MSTKPAAPTKPRKPRSERLAGKLRQQNVRRTATKATEAESFDEAVAEFRKAWELKHGVPPSAPTPIVVAQASAPTPALPEPAQTAAPSGNAPEGAPPAPVEPVKPAEQASAKPAEQASAPAGQAQAEPEITIDPAELAEAAVDVADEQAVKHLGPSVKLTEDKRARLVKALRPVLVNAFKKKGDLLPKLTPEENLFWTAALIYGPGLADKYVFGGGTTAQDAAQAAEQQAAGAGPRLVAAERTA